jgi:AAA domain (dynein-related subfamily)/CbbQ/NirQ/NorQ C-terminal
MTSRADKVQYLKTLQSRFGNTVTMQQLLELENEGVKRQVWVSGDKYRIGRGVYQLPLAEYGVDMTATVTAIKQPAPVTPVAAPVVELREKQVAKIAKVLRIDEGPSVPGVDPLYVPFGFFDKMLKVVTSNQFYPVFVSGLSGNGKTMMVEQVCAKLKREFMRVNITPETDEDDLIGGFRLIDGETRWYDGPVLQAMKSGAILCLDEIDRGSNKLMCLQGILEGKPIFVKKTGETVRPAPGFNVIATANTKGKGDETGRFMAATILDDAFLERFPITVEQEYPSTTVEGKILTRVFDSLGLQDKEFSEILVKWADIIRKTFQEGAIDELISTRRLVSIAKAYQIFGDRTEAITYCINRFDAETKTAFMDLYTKLVPEPVNVSPVIDTPEVHTEEVPF